MYKIRSADLSDIGAMVAIWYHASIKAHDFIDADFWKNQKQAMQEKYLPHAENWLLEITTDDNATKVVGFLSLVANKIAALFISPEYQRHGYGKALLKQAKDVRDSLELTVYVNNKTAVTFYQTQGFVIKKTSVDEMTGQQEHTMKYQAKLT